MKLFVINISITGYDEYKGFVVRAENAENALAIAKRRMSAEQVEQIELGLEGVDVDEIPTEGMNEGIILSSFFAG